MLCTEFIIRRILRHFQTENFAFFQNTVYRGGFRIEPVAWSWAQGFIIADTEPCLTSTLKRVCDFIVISDIETGSEAFVPSEKAGFENEMVLGLIQTLLRVTLFQGYTDRISNQECSPAGFSLELGGKDAKRRQNFAKYVWGALPTANLAKERLRIAFSRGRGKLEWGH